MSHFDTLKDDIMDSIFAECYESLYLDILELETTIELLKLKINKHYDLKDYFNSDWIDDDTRGYPFVYKKNNTIEELTSYEFNRELLIDKIEQKLLYKIK
tara:strand:- start:2189 stop:2488 length:300 start_codon:yes stop_codon:yes gene_type:complete